MISVPAILLGRKGLLVVGVLIALALLFFVATPIAAAFEAQSEERADALDQFARFRAEVASQPSLQRALAAVRIQAAAVPGLLRSPTAELAGAQLQTAIKQIIENNSGQLRSSEALPPNRENGFDRVAIQCDLTVPAARLKDLLYAVEVHAPYFFIDRAEIDAPLTWQPDGTKTAQPMLEVRWTVHAYRWVQPA
jgi:hypothetical protein